MKKSQAAYLSALVAIAPHMDQEWAMIFGGIMTLFAVVFELMERR